MTIDPRLLERRRAVAEDHAKRSVGRLLRFMTWLIVVGVLAWLAFSPWLSVAQVRTTGIQQSAAHAILVSQRVVAGTPMVMLRPGAVEEILEQDPWIGSARVHLDWPDEVIVRIDERVPVAWVLTTGGWARRGVDGISVPGPSAPDDLLPWVYLEDIGDDVAVDSLFVRGAVEFAEALPSGLDGEASIWLESGEMWADVAGFRVRLGRPVEMKTKALSLTALLREDIDEGSVLVLVAPTHPAIQPPGDTSPSGEGPQPKEAPQP